jgi:hypothetical protein
MNILLMAIVGLEMGVVRRMVKPRGGVRQMSLRVVIHSEAAVSWFPVFLSVCLFVVSVASFFYDFYGCCSFLRTMKERLRKGRERAKTRRYEMDVNRMQRQTKKKKTCVRVVFSMFQVSRSVLAGLVG